MQRTDTEMLDYVLAVVAGKDSDDPSIFHERVQAITAALTLGYNGREAIKMAMGARTFEPGEALPPLTALDLVADELKRIRESKGFTQERDDGYTEGELARAAASYVYPMVAGATWPWDNAWWKPTPNDRVSELVKGCALAVCEIERLHRAKAAEPSPQAELVLDAPGPDNPEPGVCVDSPGLDPIAGDVHQTLAPQPPLVAGHRVTVDGSLREWGGFQAQMEDLLAEDGTPRSPQRVDDARDTWVQVDGWWLPRQYVRPA